jgi:hypothetical protein
MLLSQASPQEKLEGFRLTRIFGVLGTTLIRVHSLGLISSRCEAGSSIQAAHVPHRPDSLHPPGSVAF